VRSTQRLYACLRRAIDVRIISIIWLSKQGYIILFRKYLGCIICGNSYGNSREVVLAIMYRERLGNYFGQRRRVLIIQYVGKFNYLSQYAAEYVNTDAKKKSCFMRGLNIKIQIALVTCYNATYHKVVNVAIASEEKSRIHKESKKKKQMLSSSSGGIKKRQKFIYHP
jgi:hypothetical protein